MPTIDDQNSLEFKRIADTYQCIYFVNMLENFTYIHNGEGFRIPLYVNNNLQCYIDSNSVICNGDINTINFGISTNNVQHLYANTINCSALICSHTNVNNGSGAYYIGDASYIDIIKNRVFGDFHAVSCGDVDMYLQELAKNALFNMNNVESKTGFLNKTVQDYTTNNTLEYWFDIPDEIRNNCYVVIFATFVPYIDSAHPIANHYLYVNGEHVSTVTNDNTCEDGRNMIGGTFASFVYTLTPGTLKNYSTNITIASDVNLAWGAGFNDIVLFYGK